MTWDITQSFRIEETDLWNEESILMNKLFLGDARIQFLRYVADASTAILSKLLSR